jgi:hypothetical protein
MSINIAYTKDICNIRLEREHYLTSENTIIFLVTILKDIFI